MVFAIFDFMINPDAKSSRSNAYETTDNHVSKVGKVIHPKYITDKVNITKMMTVKIINPTPAQITQAGIGS